MAKDLRERVGKQYKGTQRTRNAVHGECTVELAKWTLPIISFSREPYEAKVSRTGLTGGMGRRTVRQRALCLPSGNVRVPKTSLSRSAMLVMATPLFLPQQPTKSRLLQHEEAAG